jgi:hypothetical protein
MTQMPDPGAFRPDFSRPVVEKDKVVAAAVIFVKTIVHNICYDVSKIGKKKLLEEQAKSFF